MSTRDTSEFGRISTNAFGFLKSHDLGRLNPLLKGGIAYFDNKGNIMDTQLENPGSFPLQAYFNNVAAIQLNPISKQMMSITTLYNLLLIYLYQHNTISQADENKGKSIDKWNTNRCAATNDFQDVFFNSKVTMSNMSRDDVSTIATAHIAGFDKETKQPYKFTDLDINQMDFFRDITAQVLNDNAKNYKNRQYIPSSLGKVALYGKTKAARAGYDEVAKQLTAADIMNINLDKQDVLYRTGQPNPNFRPIVRGIARVNITLNYFFQFSSIGIVFVMIKYEELTNGANITFNTYYNDGYQQKGPKVLIIRYKDGNMYYNSNDTGYVPQSYFGGVKLDLSILPNDDERIVRTFRFNLIESI